MNGSQRTVAEPMWTQISVRVSTARRLQALGTASYDLAIDQLFAGLPAAGAQIRADRERLGITQFQLADRAGTSQMTVSRAERGDEGVSREIIVRLRRCLADAEGSRPRTASGDP